MKITAVLVSDDVRDFCEDQDLPVPADVDAWLAAHEAQITEAMDYAALNAVRSILRREGA